MNYISNTPAERERMLKTIGIERIEDLFSAIPEAVVLDRPLNIPAGLSELELLKEVKKKAARNRSLEELVSFLGAGAYDHYIPSIIDHLISRSEFYTAYTPYQAELSQGTLQAIYEFQSMICELTGMEIANASLLDGGSATGEAVLMASRLTRKRKILISKGIHPAYREVAITYGRQQGLEFKEIGLAGTTTDLESLKGELDEETGAVVVQYPNFFGSLEDMKVIQELLSSRKNTLLIVIANPIALGILKPPSDFAADIVIGEGQSLGNSLSYGGPFLGYMATKKRYSRQLPGRIAGATTDVEGKRGYVLTLQTREQHIRREKATSNICSNEALNALVATIYLATMGKEGIREVAEQSLKKAHYLAEGIDNLPGFTVINRDNFFHEFLITTPVAIAEVKQKLLEEGILAGLDISRFDYEREGLLICVTEKRTREELDRYLKALEVIAND